MEKDAGIWRTGNRLKIIDKAGQVWTITIDSVEGSLVNFTDLKGKRRAINKDSIAEARELEGDDGKTG